MTCDEKLKALKIPLFVKGSGKPLIMLHGFLSSKEAYLNQIDFFSQYFKVVAYDLCGFGKNIPMPYPYAIHDYLEEFNSIANCFDERVSVIGHSFGCRVLLYAMAKEHKIEKAVLCGAAGIKPKFKFGREAKRIIYRFARPFFKKELLEKHFFSSDYNALCDVQKRSFKLIVNYHMDNYLNQIQVPVLAVFGSKDRETPLNHNGARLKKCIKDCTLIKIEDTGHFCFLEKADVFNLIAKEFLL